jgi:hypothetical protein
MKDKHTHGHWHEGMFHEHEHSIARHHGIAFRKAPNVTHVGEDLTEQLQASIEHVRKEKHDAATDA